MRAWYSWPSGAAGRTERPSEVDLVLPGSRQSSVRMSKPWTRVPVGPSRIPTMISEEERRYLRWLTATRWVDAGHVLEIGP
jgi:hypothetical protein